MENSHSSPSHAPTLRTYLGISLFWFALSFFWGAMLVIVMPARVLDIVGDLEKDYFLALILSCGAFVSGVTQIVFGALSDNSAHRLGRRRPFLIAGVLGTTIVLLFFPGAKTVGALLAVFLGIQLFLNVANGPYQALMPDLVAPDHHGRASVYMGVCLLLGRIGGPVVAGLLLRTPHGLEKLTWVFIALLNGLMLANVLLLRERPHGHGVGVVKTLKNAFVIPLRPYPDFTWLLISRFGIMMGLYTMMFCLLYYIRDTLGQGEKAPEVVAKFMVLTTITGMLGVLPAGVASDRFSKKGVLFVSNAIAIMAGIAFAMAHDLTTATIAAGIFGAGFGTFAAVDWALACTLLPPGAPAKYLGLWSVSDVLPQVIAPLVAGPIAGAINLQTPGEGYRFLMGLSVVYFVLGTVAIKFIREQRNEVQEQEA